MAPVLRAWHTGQADRAGVMPSVEHYAHLMYTKPRSPSSVHKQAARHRTGDYPNFRELRTSELLRIPKGEVRRTPIPHTRVNKGERMSRWGNTGRDEGSVPIMGITQSVGKREVECE